MSDSGILVHSPGTKLGSPALQADSLPSEPPEKSWEVGWDVKQAIIKAAEKSSKNQLPFSDQRKLGKGCRTLDDSYSRRPGTSPVCLSIGKWLLPVAGSCLSLLLEPGYTWSTSQRVPRLQNETSEIGMRKGFRLSFKAIAAWWLFPVLLLLVSPLTQLCPQSTLQFYFRGSLRLCSGCSSCG